MACNTTETVQKRIQAHELKVGHKIIKAGFDEALPAPLEVRDVQQDFSNSLVTLVLTGMGAITVSRNKSFVVEEQVAAIPAGTVKVTDMGLGMKTKNGWVTFNRESGEFKGIERIRQDEAYWRNLPNA